MCVCVWVCVCVCVCVGGCVCGWVWVWVGGCEHVRVVRACVRACARARGAEGKGREGGKERNVGMGKGQKGGSGRRRETQKHARETGAETKEQARYEAEARRRMAEEEVGGVAWVRGAQAKPAGQTALSGSWSDASAGANTDGLGESAEAVKLVKTVKLVKQVKVVKSLSDLSVDIRCGPRRLDRDSPTTRVAHAPGRAPAAGRLKY